MYDNPPEAIAMAGGTKVDEQKAKDL